MLNVLLKMLPYVWPFLREIIMGIKKHPGVRGKPKTNRPLVVILLTILVAETDYVVKNFLEKEELTEKIEKLEEAPPAPCKDVTSINELLSSIQYQLNVEKAQHNVTKELLLEQRNKAQNAPQITCPVIKEELKKTDNKDYVSDLQKRLNALSNNP